MSTTRTPTRLTDLPLWRLIVALDDAERIVGLDSSTARALAAEIAQRLQSDRASPPIGGAPPEVSHGR